MLPAGILVILAAAKVAAIAANVEIWVSFARRVYSRPNLVVAIPIALAGCVLYLLLKSG